ncbi:polyisoprenoid-binding protein [Bizionia argentinensis JUB59]|uniref:Polyisoprenoid-binding protein n=1 Tax=Bizionia argentinensis JUB59 TaxID=1046627 RepID=G2EBH1_9FLAO|nr:YceI family protein [Bizionia argentinensis]EGV44140.2 polyisoprenoid-binding protein [Bizionia argentinensis JUB59]
MKRSIMLFLGSLTIAYFTCAQTINSNKSIIAFEIGAVGFFNVNGTFTGMTGDFNFNESELESSNFNICVDAKSVDTENAERDIDLRSDIFFEVETYPTICYKSDSISKTNEGYVTTGSLTIRNVTKIVSIPFTFKNNTFKGELEINRLNYNIGEDYGTFRVGKSATVTITCVLN